MRRERSDGSNYLDCKHPYREYEIRGCDHQCYRDHKERRVVAIIFDMYPRKAHPVVPGSSISRAGGRIPKTGFSFQFFGCPELFVRMPVAVLQPFSSCGTVDTPITASHSMPSRARRRRPPHRIPSYHILGYLGQRDEPLSEPKANPDFVEPIEQC